MNTKRLAVLLIALVFLGAACNLDKLMGKKTEDTGQTNPAPGKEKPGGETGDQETAAAPPSGNFPDQFNLYYGPTQTGILVKQEGNGKWSATESGQTLAVTVDPQFNVAFLSGDQTVASGQLKEGKLKMATADGKFFLGVKFKEEKIKVSLQEGESVTWDLKYKKDENTGEPKVKVKHGETDLGKVKFDPAKGKLKVKTESDQEVAVSKEIGRLSAGPGALLISDLKPDQRTFLMLLLFALNK